VNERSSTRPANRRTRPAVLADVARLAGVSYQTVWRVQHESPNVHAETRRRVQAAIRKLGYRPNTLAQALATGRSRTLGVVSFDRATVLDAVQRLRDQGADGIVVIAPQKSATDALRHLPTDGPLVAVEAGPDDSVPVVAVDQYAGAVAATRHLLDLGHRTVWHVAGPADWPEAIERVRGWRATLAAVGIRPPPLLRGDWSARAGYELGRKLAEDSKVTAVFVGNDQMALGFLRRLHEAGRSAPRDISVVGFDDIPEAAYFTPPLTTVRQDFAEVGRRCLHMLLGQLERAARSPSRVVVPAALVVRESTAAPGPR